MKGRFDGPAEVRASGSSVLAAGRDNCPSHLDQAIASRIVVCESRRVGMFLVRVVFQGNSMVRVCRINSGYEAPGMVGNDVLGMGDREAPVVEEREEGGLRFAFRDGQPGASLEC